MINFIIIYLFNNPEEDVCILRQDLERKKEHYQNIYNSKASIETIDKLIINNFTKNGLKENGDNKNITQAEKLELMSTINNKYNNLYLTEFDYTQQIKYINIGKSLEKKNINEYHNITELDEELYNILSKTINESKINNYFIIVLNESFIEIFKELCEKSKIISNIYLTNEWYKPLNMFILEYYHLFFK